MTGCTWSSYWPVGPDLARERFGYLIRMFGLPGFVADDDDIFRVAKVAFRDGWDMACAAHDDWVEKFER